MIEKPMIVSALFACLALPACGKSSAPAKEEAPKEITVDDYCKQIVTLSDSDDQEMAKEMKKADPDTKKQIAAMKADLTKECIGTVGTAQKKDAEGFQECARCAQSSKTWKSFIDGCDEKCDDFALDDSSDDDDDKKKP